MQARVFLSRTCKERKRPKVPKSPTASQAQSLADVYIRFIQSSAGAGAQEEEASSPSGGKVTVRGLVEGLVESRKKSHL